MQFGNGKTQIIAKTQDGSIQAEVEISVYTPAYGIVLSKENATIFTGTVMQLIANVLPEDTSENEVSWSSENEEIASVDEDGKVTGNKAGNTKIIASVGNIKTECSITVIEKQDDWILEFSDDLSVTGDEISSLPWENVAVENIRSYIETNLEISFENSNGKILEDDENIGTGSSLILKDTQGNEVFRYNFILYGDVNGDGLINSLDVLVIQKYILETKDIQGLFLKAGNISKNGLGPSALDVLKIQKHILESKIIEQ